MSHLPTNPIIEATKAPAPSETAFRAFWRAASRLRRLGEVRFAAAGLSPAQWRVLRSLHEHRVAGRTAVRATDLCNELLLTKATVSGLLSRLVRMGLVTRSRIDRDHRALAVSLTAAGRKTVASISSDHSAWTRNLMAGLTTSEQRRLTKLLDTLCCWLDPLVERTGGPTGPLPAGRPAPSRNRRARSVHS